MTFYEDGAAVIERGRVISLEAQGKCRVESRTREGVVTMALEKLPGLEPAVGDEVFFFEFEDGDGLIIGLRGE